MKIVEWKSALKISSGQLDFFLPLSNRSVQYFGTQEMDRSKVVRMSGNQICFMEGGQLKLGKVGSLNEISFGMPSSSAEMKFSGRELRQELDIYTQYTQYNIYTTVLQLYYRGGGGICTTVIYTVFGKFRIQFCAHGPTDQSFLIKLGTASRSQLPNLSQSHYK